MTTLTIPLLEAPASDDIMARETLAYAEAHDAVLNADYAFVAYKETHRSSGAWCLRIASLAGGGAYFHPNAMRLQARAATAEGEASFLWGSVCRPRPSDARKIEFRVHVCDGEATAIEIYLRLRRPDHTADEPVQVVFPWPEV